MRWIQLVIFIQLHSYLTRSLEQSIFFPFNLKNYLDHTVKFQDVYSWVSFHFFSFFCLLGPHWQHMEVLRLGVELEL